MKKTNWTDEKYIREEAMKRNMTVHQLQTKIMQVVLNDRMIAAILDDE